MRTSLSPALDLAALERAYLQGITARRVSASHWQASSSAGDGTLYDVTLERDAITCTCPAREVGRSCKHAALVRVLAASGAVPLPEQPTRPRSHTALLAHERRIGKYFLSDDPDDLPF